MTKQRKKSKKILAFLLSTLMVVTLLPAMLMQASENSALRDGEPNGFAIQNPYHEVDWEEFGQYRAALHIHTTISDGSATVAETVLDHYNKGFDIIAITDHSNWGGGRQAHNGDWATGPDSLTESQRDAVIDGTFGRTVYSDFAFPGDFGPGFYRPEDQGGMIAIPFTNEQSRTEHIITMWADFTDQSGATTESTLQATDDLGGLAILAHPGRYTTGAGGNPASSHNPLRISRYIELFDRFESVLGFEIFNRNDNETRADRVLWDNVLMELMPYGRPIWGFANDDSHSMNQAGFNWNVLLLPELDEDYAKEAMREGAFYMVARVNRGIGVTDPTVNATMPDGSSMPNGGNANTVFMLHESAPSIINIEIYDDRIIIEADDYNYITWVADGAIIHTGNYLDVDYHWDFINSNYVRAQIVGDHGVAMTQPFGVHPYGEELPNRPETNNLVSIDEPQPVYVRHGAEATPEGLRLPGTVQVVTERGWRSAASIEWDMDSIYPGYDPEEEEAIQTFTLTGAVNLEGTGVTNDNDVSLSRTITVTVGLDARISMAEANLNRAVGDLITVEGFVTGIRGNGQLVIQDSNEEWGALFVQNAGGTGPDVPNQLTAALRGQWIRVSGSRHVQWHNNAVMINTATGFGYWEVIEDTSDRPVIEATKISIDELQLGVQGQWNNMLVTFTAPLVHRDYGVDGGAAVHQLRHPNYGRVEVACTTLPSWAANTNTIEVDRGIVHWRNDLESHRIHANWALGTITVLDGVEPEGTRIDILTYSDFHGTVDGVMNDNDPGAEVFVAHAMWQRAQNPNPDNVVFISGGDDFHGHPVSNFNYTRTGPAEANPPVPIPDELPIGRGAPVLAMMGYLGQEYMPLGNHELSFGFARTQELAQYINFLAADLFYVPGHPRAGERPDIVQPYTILEFEDGDITIGVIGLMTRGMGHLVADPAMNDFDRRTPTAGYNWVGGEAVATADVNPAHAQAIEDLIQELRDVYGVDAVVASTHMYGNEMRILANIIEGFDAIIGGHGHQRIAETVNGTPILEAGQHGRSLGRLSLYFEEGDLDDVTVTLNPLNSIRDFAPTSVHRNSQNAEGHPDWAEFAHHHTAMAEIMYYYHRQSSDILDRVLGTRSIYSETRDDRNFWATRLVLDYVTANARVVPTDEPGVYDTYDNWIYFSNFGGWRNVPPFTFGPDTNVTLRELYTTMPFENTILLYEMYGRELITLLSMEASADATVNPPTFGLNGGQPVVVAGAVRGERLDDVVINGVPRPRWEWIQTCGTPINDDDTIYRVIGSNFTAGAAADRFPVPGNPWGNAMGQRVVAPPLALMADGTTRPWSDFSGDDSSTFVASGLRTLRHAMVEQQTWRYNNPGYTSTLEVVANGNGVAEITAPFAPGDRTSNVVITPTRVRLTATPDAEYDFVGWFSGRTLLSEELILNITIGEDSVIEARFEGYEPPVITEPGVVPYPTLQVANGTEGDTWDTSNVLENRFDVYRYRLNFSFPVQEGEEHNLRSFTVEFRPPGFVDTGAEELVIRTVEGDVDVTDYFIITKYLGWDSVGLADIVAKDIALNNPKFYGEWAELYLDIEAQVVEGHSKLPPGYYNPLVYAEYFRLSANIVVSGEYADGESFNLVSNNAYTYYGEPSDICDDCGKYPCECLEVCDDCGKYPCECPEVCDDCGKYPCDCPELCDDCGKYPCECPEVCDDCGKYPCECPEVCDDCGKYPCECPEVCDDCGKYPCDCPELCDDCGKYPCDCPELCDDCGKYPCDCPELCDDCGKYPCDCPELCDDCGKYPCDCPELCDDCGKYPCDCPELCDDCGKYPCDCPELCDDCKKYPCDCPELCDDCKKYPCDCPELCDDCKKYPCDCPEVCDDCKKYPCDCPEVCDDCNRYPCRCREDDGRRPTRPKDRPVPKTGDEANMTLWIAILALGGLGVLIATVAISIDKRKKKKEEEAHEAVIEDDDDLVIKL